MEQAILKSGQKFNCKFYTVEAFLTKQTRHVHNSFIEKLVKSMYCMPQSDFKSLQPWTKHINNMANSLNISQKCCGEQGFCQRRRLFPKSIIWCYNGRFGPKTQIRILHTSRLTQLCNSNTT